MNDIVRMADGTMYECIYLGQPWRGAAYITLVGVTFSEAAAIFGDSKKTKRMDISGAEGVTTLEGYTSIYAMVVTGNDVRATMEVPHD